MNKRYGRIKVMKKLKETSKKPVAQAKDEEREQVIQLII